MSRTTLCLLTAALLAICSIGSMVGRYCVLGDEVKVPNGPGTWKVTLLVQGKSSGPDPKLYTALPLDFGHQHVLKEDWKSQELHAKPPDVKHPERHHILWTKRPGINGAKFRARYQCICTVQEDHRSTSMTRRGSALHGSPQAGENLMGEAKIESEHNEIAVLARKLTAATEDARDQFDAMYKFVEKEIDNEPGLSGMGVSALECLKEGSGDSAGKSRLLVALCRNRGIPARIVTGVALKRGDEQAAHVWVEAWVHNRWLPACPSYHHFGRVPSTYLVFSHGDIPVVRGKNVRDLDYAFLVERPSSEDGTSDGSVGSFKKILLRLSLFALPPAEQRLVEFLLLLPIAALIVCIFRNMIGIDSFGTFAPALVGLAFRDLGGLPGIVFFVSIVVVGWLMRRILDYYRLLQVPRMAFLLSLVVILLIGSIVTANINDLPATKYISLFPMVILTGMIERFWTQEVEDGASSSFKTLFGTMFIAASISLFLSLHAVVQHMLRYPETLGVIMAVQLLIGRYTGYRISELFRFRDFLRRQTPATFKLRIPPADSEAITTIRVPANHGSED